MVPSVIKIFSYFGALIKWVIHGFKKTYKQEYYGVEDTDEENDIVYINGYLGFAVFFIVIVLLKAC